AAAGADAAAGQQPKPKAPGHGRNGAAAYVGAVPVPVPHGSLDRGDPCPACEKGKVYPLAQPEVLIRVRAMAPLQASRFELERLRCNTCGEVFTAERPEGVGPDKYDETAASMIGLLRYDTGVPFNRIARLEKGFGIPLPPPTQWEVVERGAGLMTPAHDELLRQAAQGKLLHNDDPKMKVLELMAESRRQADDADDDRSCGERTGIFTSAILGVADGHEIALFFTGHQHAGENLADVLARRAAELPPPIQMCDALSANTAGELHTIVANCLAHARRGFVDVAANFPDECRHVLEELRKVYQNDALARKQQLSDDERLRFHQAERRPVMADLKAWMAEQIAERKIEPNSGLGQAIAYMTKHWPKLTLFLEKPGAPLDNNAVERVLKKAICHRKNSLFYKTLNGARVGDIYMSLIHTAELNAASPFEYLVALQRYHDKVADCPADWMPWNYREALAKLTKGPAPPA
ncbi:MAG: IS66 family transposase, partial [Myxococcota bacterium]|nr:IS66 family transposase [Myxococcota bacterium]